MINYNIVLYIGLFLIVGGFCLFLYSQMRLRQLEIEEFKNNQLLKSFSRAKEKEKKWQIVIGPGEHDFRECLVLYNYTHPWCGLDIFNWINLSPDPIE